MSAVLLKILPVIAIFILGFFLKKGGLLRREHGALFLKLVFYAAFPALLLNSVSGVELVRELAFLPVIAVLIIFITTTAAYFAGKLFHLERTSYGVFLISSVIMNLGFTYPFFIAAYGDEGLARATLFDFGNGLLVFSFVFYLACRYGGHKKDGLSMAKKVVLSPPLWAFLTAVTLNLLDVRIPGPVTEFCSLLGQMTVPLIMLALGVYFSPKIVKPGPLSAVILIRMGFGFLLGLMFSALFHLEGLNRSVVLIGASAPVGYNALTFSSLEKLDEEFAASVISWSILIGILLIPVLILLIH
jgi:predicted permease